MAKKSKKPTVQKLKKKVWKIFSEYIRLRDALATTGDPMWLICCTCGKKYPAFGLGCAQAGHYIAGRKNAYLFDKRLVHGQCYNCNINLKGNSIPYRKFLVKKYNEETVKALEELYYQTQQYKTYELEELLTKYKQKVQDLKANGK